MKTTLSKRPKVRDLLAFLRSIGCEPTGERKGSHEKWRTPGGRTFPVVVNHVAHDADHGVLSTVRQHLRAEGLL